MEMKRINLTEDGRVFLMAYLLGSSPEMPETAKKPAVLVVPGGGYQMTSDREAEPIAFAFAAQGFHTFVLRYSVGPYAVFPRPLLELSESLKRIRENADAWGVRADAIAVAGFSAGGHLAASLGVYWNDPEIQRAAGCTNEENRPNALILCYPVITSGRETHEDSIETLMQEEKDEAKRTCLREKLALERHVGPHTPPCFIMHTYFDQAVPVENSLLFAQALAAHDVPFEMHIVQDGIHGLALANKVTCVGMPEMISEPFARWTADCGRWLRDLFEDNAPQARRYESAAKRRRPKRG